MQIVIQVELITTGFIIFLALNSLNPQLSSILRSYLLRLNQIFWTDGQISRPHGDGQISKRGNYRNQAGSPTSPNPIRPYPFIHFQASRGRSNQKARQFSEPGRLLYISQSNNYPFMHFQELRRSNNNNSNQTDVMIHIFVNTPTIKIIQHHLFSSYLH